MIQRLVRLFLVFAFSLALPLAAQEADDTTDTLQVEIIDSGALELTTEMIEAAEALPDVFDDYDSWNAFAERAGISVAQGRASNGALAELRGDLADWRDVFLGRQSINSGRINTVRAQISALGDVPETGDEDARVAARRAELSIQLQQLQAPVKLATEAYNQADGLIAEIDSLVRGRQADTLSERIQSPLNPSGWAHTYEAVAEALRANLSDLRRLIDTPNRWSTFISQLPASLVLAALALVLVLRGPRWFGRFASLLTTHTRRGQGVVRFVLSLGQIIIPFAGLVMLCNAVELTGLAGRRTQGLVDAVPMLGLFPILSHWLAGLLLPMSGSIDSHPLLLPEDRSAKANRRFIVLGYTMMAFGLVRVFAISNSLDDVAKSVLLFPFGVLMSWTLCWLGHKLRHTPTSEDGDIQRSFRQSLRGILSRGLLIVSLIGLVCASLGYATSFEAFPYPAGVTLYVLGILLLLQRLSVDVYTLWSKAENAAQDALIPVLIGFALILVALPILAVIWGAQVTDLTELWTRFREGFSIGETKISPTSFLMFAVIFLVGYMITRLSQAALRTTVLPRTKLDIGGQNAIVAGVGYVGIFLAALIAITTAGIDLSGLAIVAGALSVGIGFGLQNIVSNFVSGIILLIERPISEGDWIEVSGQMGYVRDISVRSTRIETFDHTDVIVPNSDLVSGQVINWTRGNSVGRVIVSVGVAYGTDTDRVAAILKEIAVAHPMVLMNPEPYILFRGFGADSLDFEIRAILRDVNWVLNVKSDLNHAIAKRFVEEDIEIPFAQRDLWLRNPETLNARPADVQHAKAKPTKPPKDEPTT